MEAEKQKFENVDKDGWRWGTLRLRRGRIHEIEVFDDGSFIIREIGPASATPAPTQ